MRLQTTRIYTEIDKAYRSGYAVCSEQGSSRSSKTYNTLIWIIVHCLTFPNTSVSICRAALPSLRGSAMRDFLEILQRIGVYEPRAFNKGEFIYHFNNGSWVEFFSCDSEQKLRGRKRQILYVNEANELKFIEWQQLQLRTTEFSIVDYNPSFSDDHWICQLNQDNRTYHFITTYKDNPFLEQKIVDEIESLQHKNESLWRVYGLGLQAQVEGLIFQNVDVVNEIPSAIRKRCLGVDYGFTNDPTAIVEVAWTDTDIYIREIAYATEMLTSDIIKVLKQEDERTNRTNKVISESADPRLVQEIYRAGINIHPVRKFGRKIDSISKMLEYNIHVTADSLNIQKELKNYVYAQDKEGHFINEPIDGYDHALDASRYVVMMEIMGGKLREVSDNDLLNDFY